MVVQSILDDKEAHLEKIRTLFTKFGADVSGGVTFAMFEEKLPALFYLYIYIYSYLFIYLFIYVFWGGSGPNQGPFLVVFVFFVAAQAYF